MNDVAKRGMYRQVLVKLAEFIESGIITSLELDVLLDQQQRQHWDVVRQQVAFRLFDQLRNGAVSADQLDILSPQNKFRQQIKHHELVGISKLLYQILERICLVMRKHSIDTSERVALEFQTATTMTELSVLKNQAVEEGYLHYVNNQLRHNFNLFGSKKIFYGYLKERRRLNG